MIPLLIHEQGFSTENLAQVVFVFSAAYTAGQFLMGRLADFFGARITVTLGMLASALAMGLVGTSQTLLWLSVFQIVNGFAQASGWSGLVKLMGNWLPPRRRGVTMAWWSTNYVFGGFLATTLATAAATASWLGPVPWRRVAWLPAIVLAVVALIFAGSVRNSPDDAGWPSATPVTPMVSDDQVIVARELTESKNRSLLANRAFQPLAAAYLCVKLIRYTFLFWLPLYLTQQLAFMTKEAGYLSAAFELAGVVGVVCAGYLSDRLFNSRRFPVAALMLVTLGVVSCIGHQLTQLGLPGVAAYLALLGIFTYGPDTLLVGAAAQDVSSRGRTGTAVGTLDGIGSVGVFLSPYLVSTIVPSFGWTVLFGMLAFVAFISAGILCLGIPREKALHSEIDRIEELCQC